MSNKLTEAVLLKAGDSIDRLINIDLGARGSADILFQAGRELLDNRPMILSAAELMIKSVKKGDHVFITTGFMDMMDKYPGKSETDGPPGAAAIVRAVKLGLNAIPIIVTDECLADDIRRIANCDVIGMPVQDDKCRLLSSKLLDGYKPSLCLSIERAGMNKQGRMHRMSGYDISEFHAKMDHLFTGAKARNIATIGIGDGGNEIGMANIEKTVREKIVHGNRCQCPCGCGIALDVSKVDVLVCSAVSNWAGYALSWMIALLTGNTAAGCDEATADAVLEACAELGLHDAMTGEVIPWVDGTSKAAQLNIISLIREIVKHC